jgi:hypothetical protein
MERGSIIDAQIELQEQNTLELNRCLDPLYFYMTYMKIDRQPEGAIKPKFGWIQNPVYKQFVLKTYE